MKEVLLLKLGIKKWYLNEASLNVVLEKFDPNKVHSCDVISICMLKIFHVPFLVSPGAYITIMYWECKISLQMEKVNAVQVS